MIITSDDCAVAAALPAEVNSSQKLIGRAFEHGSQQFSDRNRRLRGRVPTLGDDARAGLRQSGAADFLTSDEKTIPRLL